MLPDLSSPRKQEVGRDFSGVNVVTRIMQQMKTPVNLPLFGRD